MQTLSLFPTRQTCLRLDGQECPIRALSQLRDDRFRLGATDAFEHFDRSMLANLIRGQSVERFE